LDVLTDKNDDTDKKNVDSDKAPEFFPLETSTGEIFLLKK